MRAWHVFSQDGFVKKKKRLLTDWHEMRGVGVIRSLEKKGEGREAFREGQCD